MQSKIKSEIVVVSLGAVLAHHSNPNEGRLS